jgi:MoaA/NifB/PqqE/SkfB family radical SAM enzyme
VKKANHHVCNGALDAHAIRELARLRVVPNGTMILGIDFTSRCNLRCIYCFQSQAPDYFYKDTAGTVSIDIDENMVSKIVELAMALKVGSFLVGFAGETLIVDQWQSFLSRLIETGIPVQLTTNLSMILDADDAAILAKCAEINVSVDVIDLKLARKIRRKSDTRTMIYNIMLIKSASLMAQLSTPTIKLYAVVSDKIIPELKKLFAFAVTAGIPEVLLMGLDTDYIKEFQPKLGEVEIADPASLEGARREEAISAMTEALLFAERNGLRIVKNEGMERLFHDAGKIGRPGDGWTKDCLQPWMQPMIKANGGVEPCCHGFGEVGQLSAQQSFVDAFNTQKMFELREGLLSGNLPRLCANCSIPSWIRTQDFAHSLVRRLEINSDGTASLHRLRSRKMNPTDLIDAIRWRRRKGQSWGRITSDAVARLFRAAA